MIRRENRGWVWLAWAVLWTATLSACGGTVEADVVAVGPDEALLSWEAPVTNSDGTPLTNLAGFKVYWGIESGAYPNMIDVGNVTTYKLTRLSPKTRHYFAVTAYNAVGVESQPSAEAFKDMP